MISRQSVASALAEARDRTLLLISGISDEDLHRQHDALMSPIIWDIGHIAHFEELWLTRNLDGPIEFSEMPGLYNPMEHPRAERASLPLPTLQEMLTRLAGIRERVLERLEKADFANGGALLSGAYVYNMVLQHEYQHNETILQTLQLKLGAPYHPPVKRKTPEPNSPPSGMVRFPGGEVLVGTSDTSAAYDNERPTHMVRLRPFLIDRIAVTNSAYIAFMMDRGYTRAELWSEEGWRWLQDSRVEAPKYWERAESGWVTRGMDEVAAPVPDSPVCHVCFHEADAFARWSGKRLPTEMEWEAAAGWDPEAGAMRAYPWGDGISPDDANIDQLAFSTAPAGSFARNWSPIGCYGMIGDVWEWTSSPFTGYPGFQTFPYKEYSEDSFGSDYRVLRGGSWATRAGAIRNSFRNWDYPIRRQIFSGFRCVRDD